MDDCILIDVLRDPIEVSEYSLTEWDLLVRQARSANLLAHLGMLLEQVRDRVEVPEPVRMHLDSAAMIVRRQNSAIRWEISQLQQALSDLAVPIILLKGAAYVQAGLPCGRQRLFSDIDILVPRAALEDVEEKLRAHGWRTTHNNAYDQRYYRRWMHELPPMQHSQRQTVLDVHHSILPLTARLHPDPRKMIDSAVADPDLEYIYWLAPEDMLLHSMTHLFHDGELENGLRDLVDLQLLFNEFGKQHGFGTRLAERAQELGLTRPFYYGSRYMGELLQTAIPSEDSPALSGIGSPGWLLQKLMDRLFVQGLKPTHASCSSPLTLLARKLLYTRSHYLRMPLHLLVPHLVRKAMINDHEDERLEKLKRLVDYGP